MRAPTPPSSTTHTNPLLHGERAENGIGTMLVFIALVLTASMAASLLVNTANELQQQGQETGRQAIVEVSTGITIDAITGDRDSTPTDNGDQATSLQDDIQYLGFLIRLSAGSPEIALQNSYLELSTDEDLVRLTFNGSASAIITLNGSDDIDDRSRSIKANASSTQYTGLVIDIANRTRTDDFPTVLMMEGDIVYLFVNVTATGLTISPNLGGQATLITQFGTQTTKPFTMPEAFTGRYVSIT